MHMSVSQNIDMVAGLGAVIVTESGRGGACRITCLAILRLKETHTTSNSLRQALCNLLGIIAAAARV